VTTPSDGSATIWALITVLVIWVAAAVGTLEIAAVQVRHEAAAAADAAALAAAAEGGLDATRACAAARRAAERVDAVLTGCRMDGPYATVSVQLAPPRVLRWAGSSTGRAKAGPADTGRGIKNFP
jgi:secretion/DNA translocation related TadE-like protein